MLEVSHWQAESLMETSLLRCKGHNNRGKVLCQHVCFQSRGFNQGKRCSQDNLEHITPWKEACTFASITMINISNKKMHSQWTPPHEGSRRGSVVSFWRCNSDSNHRGQIGFHGHLEFISSFCQGLETCHWNTLTYTTFTDSTTKHEWLPVSQSPHSLEVWGGH